jgi:hypothetical protein
MDDIDAPDLYFLTPSEELAGRIDKEPEALQRDSGSESLTTDSSGTPANRLSLNPLVGARKNDTI